MRAVHRRLAAALLLPSLAACAPAASDNDGETVVAGTLAAPPAKGPDPVPVVVDSDLAPDDLTAIAYLVRHPAVEVLAITVPTTGMVTCSGGVGLLGDFFASIAAEPVPVACGEAQRGEHSRPFPPAWTSASLTSSGVDRSHGGPPPRVVDADAATHLSRLADRVDGLHVVALGPLTEVAEMQRSHPSSYARLAGIISMAGIVDAESHDADLGVGEWNAAADADAFAEVVAGSVPLTIVPDDPVPSGRPAGLAAPVVGRLGNDPAFSPPALWDLATAGAFTTPAAVTYESGTWEVDLDDDLGRLRRTGDGPVRVVTGLDSDELDRAYAAVFGTDLR